MKTAVTNQAVTGPTESGLAEFGPAKSRLAAIILAGGQSRRMGQDKALLRLQGEALLTRTCHLAQTVSDRPRVIAACQDYQSLLPEGCELHLEAQTQGPLTAFAFGLDQLKPLQPDPDSWVLLLACDLPLLSLEDVTEAIARLEALSPEIDAYLPPSRPSPDRTPAINHPQHLTTVPKQAKKIDWEPLCGFYRQRCRTSLETALAQGTRSFQHWLTAIKVAPLTHWPAEHLLNCNHPKDWSKVLKTITKNDGQKSQ